MNPSPQTYRDDGAISGIIARASGRIPVPSAALTTTAVVALTAGLFVDGAVTGLATLLGVVAFVVLASAAARRGGGRWTWVTPPLLRVSEYGFVACLGWRDGSHALPWVFVLLAVTAFHHYDLIYRVEHQGAPPPRWVDVAGLGWDGRVAVLLAATLAGQFSAGVIALALWCAGVFFTESARGWRQHLRTNPPDGARGHHDTEFEEQ